MRRIVTVVQARLTSARLPGKVLRPLCGRPLVGHLIDALRHCREIDDVVLATSDDESDEPLVTFAEAEGLRYWRGSLHDVAGRVLGAAEWCRADALVRVCADSPLLDPMLVDRAVALFRQAAPDVVTNVLPRTFPKGQSVEVVSRAALARAVALMASAEEREHVTRHFYAHPTGFTIRTFSADSPRPDVQLSVDDADDLTRCAAILQALGQPAWVAGWEACVRASDALAPGAGT